MFAAESREPVTAHVRRLWSFGLIAVLGAVTFAWMFNATGGEDGLTSIDAVVSTWFADHRSPAISEWGLLLAQLTSPPFILVAVVVATAMLLRRGRRIDAVLLTGASALACCLGLVAKHAGNRGRPSYPVNLAPESEPSFPSGHVLVLATITAVAVGLAWPHLTRASRALVVGAAMSANALVAVDRLVVGSHWLTDVLGSFALATTIAGLLLASNRFLRPAG